MTPTTRALIHTFETAGLHHRFDADRVEMWGRVDGTHRSVTVEFEPVDGKSEKQAEAALARALAAMGWEMEG